MSHPTQFTSAPLLADVVAAGGCLPADEFSSLVTKHGLITGNGYFGTREPSMEAVGALRCITPAGRRRAR